MQSFILITVKAEQQDKTEANTSTVEENEEGEKRRMISESICHTVFVKNLIIHWHQLSYLSPKWLLFSSSISKLSHPTFFNFLQSLCDILIFLFLFGSDPETNSVFNTNSEAFFLIFMCYLLRKAELDCKHNHTSITKLLGCPTKICHFYRTLCINTSV